MQAFRCVQPTHLRPCLHFLTGFHVLTFTNMHDVAASTSAGDDDGFTQPALNISTIYVHFIDDFFS